MADKYKVVLGLSIVKENGGNDFADFGLVYRNMGYEDVVKVEGVFAKHAQVVVGAMEGLIGDLIQMGMDQIPEKKGNEAQTSNADYPGAIR